MSDMDETGQCKSCDEEVPAGTALCPACGVGDLVDAQNAEVERLRRVVLLARDTRINRDRMYEEQLDKLRDENARLNALAVGRAEVIEGLEREVKALRDALFDVANGDVIDPAGYAQDVLDAPERLPW